MVTRSRIWWTFLWLGCTGFGGGLAVLAQIHSMVVVRRGWLTDGEFWEAAALGQSLPGSAAANAIGYIGLRLQGLLGALLAFSAFILPSFLMMLGLTAGYRALHQVPNTARIFLGLNAAVVGLVLAVSVKLGRRALTRGWHWLVAILACSLLLLRLATVVEVVLVAGILGIFLDSLRRQKSAARPEPHIERKRTLPKDLSHSPDLPLPENDSESGTESKDEKTDKAKPFLALPLPLLLLLSIGTVPLLVQLAFLFLRVGAVTFGGGFVMIPLIEQEVVNNARWLNHQEFVDGMALGQITPGPVIITATFVGYYVGGLAGATVATIAVFLPSFIMTVIAGNYLARMRASPQMEGFLEGVLPAVTGMIVAALVILARAGIHTVAGALLAGLCATILLRWRISPALLLLGAALIGLVIS